jgi:hypothetical protein
MREPATDLERQVEAAFHFRGNVTIALTSGETFEGFLFNRELSHPKLREAPYVDVFRKGKPGVPERIRLDALASVTLTGTDHAKYVLPPVEE